MSDKQIKEKKEMRRPEKYFWTTIVILAILTLLIMAAGWYNNRKISTKPVIQKSIIVTETLKPKLDAQKGEISASLKEKQQKLENHIRQEVEKLFRPVYNNIDPFLDFHYSVLGEYTELGAAATNSFAKLIEERLFGENFQDNHKKILDALSKKLQTLEAEHGKEIASLASKDIDQKINPNLMKKLTEDSLYRVGATLATVGGIKAASKALIGKLSLKLAGKLSSKFGAKLFVKTGVKTGGKAVAAGSAGALGLSCGPLAIICSPALAIGAWFAADAVVSSVDEMLTRDDFHQELVFKIDEIKAEMILKLQAPFVEELVNFSKNIVEDFGKVEVKHTVKEMIQDH